jgi:hypothetical protein
MPANDNDITALEEALDRTFSRNPLPHPNRVLATWYCLTASEDAQRILFLGPNAGIDLPSARIVFYVDRYKYSLRYALDRISKESTDRHWVEVPRKVVPKLYQKAAQLMFAGIEYSLASQICSVLYADTATLTKGADAWRVRLHESHHDSAYKAMEILGVARPQVPDVSTMLFRWIRAPTTAPAVVDRIARTTAKTRDMLSYTYHPQAALSLADELPQPPRLIPEQWTFPWGTFDDTSLLSNALALRCAYHILAIHFGSKIHGLKGGGDSNIVLVLPRDSLIADLELMSSLNRKIIAAYVDGLTWGRNTQTPDPALQPLIPLTSRSLAIPCIHLLSSDQQRNLLSLMARTQSQAFDAQSRFFERDMISRLESSHMPPGVLWRSNIHVSMEGMREEVDFVLADVTRRQALICELRWMLGPGDPREIHNRNSECRKKVEQIRRKVEWISSRAAKALETIFGSSARVDTGTWQVSGIVLIAGYAGTRSPDPHYPIVPPTTIRRRTTSCTNP